MNKRIKKNVILFVNIVGSLIALPFLIRYYLSIRVSDLAAINLFGLLVFVMGPLYFISPIVAYVIKEKKKDLSIIIKSIILLIMIEYIFTSLLVVKGMDLLYSLVTILVFALICSSLGYISTKLVYKHILKR